MTLGLSDTTPRKRHSPASQRGEDTNKQHSDRRLIMWSSNLSISSEIPCFGCVYPIYIYTSWYSHWLHDASWWFPPPLFYCLVPQDCQWIAWLIELDDLPGKNIDSPGNDHLIPLNHHMFIKKTVRLCDLIGFSCDFIGYIYGYMGCVHIFSKTKQRNPMKSPDKSSISDRWPRLPRRSAARHTSTACASASGDRRRAGRTGSRRRCEDALPGVKWSELGRLEGHSWKGVKSIVSIM